MPTLHPQYIKDTAGNQLVVLPQTEFEWLMAELEDLEDIRLYDEAKKRDMGERIPLEDAFERLNRSAKTSSP